MIKKFYDNIKNFITSNYLFLLFLLLFYTVCTYPVPYYIYSGGGIVNVNDKIVFKNKTSSKGSYNLCYVSEIKANVLTYTVSKIIPSWDTVKIENLNKNESDKDIVTRDKIYLDSSYEIKFDLCIYIFFRFFFLNRITVKSFNGTSLSCFNFRNLASTDPRDRWSRKNPSYTGPRDRWSILLHCHTCYT